MWQFLIKQIDNLILTLWQNGTDNSAMEIGQVIKALRAECGLSQESLALEVETATSNLSRIEKGQRTPSLDLLQRLAKAFGIGISDIFKAVEGGELPLLKTVKPDMLLDNALADYANDAVELRKIFRKLSVQNRLIALELLRALKRIQ